MMGKDRCIPSCACSSSWCCIGNTTTSLLSRTLSNSNRCLYIFDRLDEANDCREKKKKFVIRQRYFFTFCNVNITTLIWLTTMLFRDERNVIWKILNFFSALLDESNKSYCLPKFTRTIIVIEIASPAMSVPPLHTFKIFLLLVILSLAIKIRII